MQASRIILFNATLLLATPGWLASADKALPPKLAESVRVGSASGGPADDDTTRAVIQRAVAAVYPALVRVHVVTEQGEEGKMQKRRASGSGAIISEDGYLVTNHHVAGRASRVVCRLSDREEVDAVVVGTDALSDICVLKLDLKSRRNKSKLPVAKFGNSDKLKVGDVVLAMGSPAGLSQSVTKGIVANLNMISPGGSMMLDGERVGELVRWIGHDAVIYPGNSGGPLVNLQGEIVGVNEVAIGSLGGAIPSLLAQAVAKEIIAKGSVTRSWIGLDVQPLLKKMSHNKGVLAATILEGSPAAAAGLHPGDFITSFNGTPVLESRAQEDIPVFNRLVLNAPVGSKITLQGEREGQPATWAMTTVAREPNLAREVELKSWGLTARDFTRVTALALYRKDKKGVLLHSVSTVGPSAESKPPLRPLDIITRVNGSEITCVADLRQVTEAITRGATEPKPVVVQFDRQLQQMLTVVRVGPEAQEEKPVRVDKAWLGAQTQVLTSDLAEALGVEGKPGVRVTWVMKDSPGDKAGIRPGDLFLKLDGQVIPATTPADEEVFNNLIRQHKVGSSADLEGLRDGKAIRFSLVLTKRPKPVSELEQHKDDQFEFTAREMTLTDRLEARLDEAFNGVLVSKVEPAGWAALAGLGVGDILISIDGQPVGDVPALKAALKKCGQTKPRQVLFFVKRGISNLFIEVEPNW
jgi:serine protease Do